MSNSIKRISSSEWDALIQDYRNSGLAAAKWCEHHGFKTHQLHWQINKRNKSKKNEQVVQWVPVDLNNHPVSSSQSITVKIGNAEIIVSKGYNKELFDEVIHSLSSLC